MLEAIAMPRSTAVQHMTFESTKLTGGPALLPDPVIWRAPAAAHRVDDRPGEIPVPLGEVDAGAAQAVHEVDDGTEHVQLELVLREVPDPHRS